MGELTRRLSKPEQRKLRLSLLIYSDQQILLFRPFPAFKPRKCYECASMEECEAAKPKICPNDDDRCYKVSTEVTHKDANVKLTTYSKGCTSKSQCDNKNAHFFHQTCAADDGSDCDMTCCEEDMCNAGSNFAVSAFALLACALFAAVRL